MPPLHTRAEERPDLPVDILTQREFNSRFLTSYDGFGNLIHACFDASSGERGASPMVSWISRARFVFACADPWIANDNPRPVLYDLAVDSLTHTAPISVEIVELLEAMVKVCETPGQSSVEELTNTLTWTVEALQVMRRKATEIVVASFIDAGMPVAARGALVRIKADDMSATTAHLLAWADVIIDDLPLVHREYSQRDVAFTMLSKPHQLPERSRAGVADLVKSSSPDDRLVHFWAEKLQRDT